MKQRVFAKTAHLVVPFSGGLVDHFVSTDSPTRGHFRGSFRGQRNPAAQIPEPSHLCLVWFLDPTKTPVPISLEPGEVPSKPCSCPSPLKR